jgi:hypothetical protein
LRAKVRLISGRPPEVAPGGGDKALLQCLIDGLSVIADGSSKINGPEKLL